MGMKKRAIASGLAMETMRDNGMDLAVSEVVDLADYLATGRKPYDDLPVATLESTLDDDDQITATHDQVEIGEKFRCSCGKVHTKRAEQQIQAAYGFEYSPPNTFKQIKDDGTTEIIQPGTSLHELLMASVRDQYTGKAPGEDDQP